MPWEYIWMSNDGRCPWAHTVPLSLFGRLNGRGIVMLLHKLYRQSMCVCSGSGHSCETRLEADTFKWGHYCSRKSGPVSRETAWFTGEALSVSRSLSLCSIFHNRWVQMRCRFTDAQMVWWNLIFRNTTLTSWLRSVVLFTVNMAYTTWPQGKM